MSTVPVLHAGGEAMEDCANFIDSLSRQRVTLWVDGDGLRYRAPTGALSNEQLASLRRMKQEIIGVLRQRGGSSAGPSAIHWIHRVHPESGAVLAPLTAQQEFLWRRIKAGGPSHLDSFAWRLVGALNRESLRGSLQWLMLRHDSLRTRVVELNGTPLQQVDALASYDLTAMNCSGMSEPELTEALAPVMESDCDLAVGPLFDARLIELSEREHLLILSIHHIIADGYAINLIWRELWQAYVASLRGTLASVGEVPTQYGAYAFWQRQVRQSRMEAGDSYWQERLAGAEAIKWRVGDDEIRPRFADWTRIPLGRSLSDSLRKLATDAGTTSAMLMLSLYAMVISRWCLQRDFVLATTVTGRDRPELESMAGYCASAVYLRIQISPGATMHDVLSHVSQEFHRALSHYDFGEAAANRPALNAGALFQFIPWRSDPNVIENGAIKVAPYPIRRRKEGAFSAYRIVTAFFESDEGFVVAGSVERLISDLQSTAWQLVRDRNASLLAAR